MVKFFEDEFAKNIKIYYNIYVNKKIIPFINTYFIEGGRVALRIFEATRPQVIDLISLIAQQRQIYSTEHPDYTTYDFKAVTKYDIFGRPIQEVGSLDQLTTAQHQQLYIQERDTWVFKQLLNELGIDYFNEIVAVLGNPGRLNPCDGEWHQCTYFCEKYNDCPYEIKKAQNEEEAANENTKVSSAAKRNNNNKRSSGKRSKRKKSKK